MNDNQYPQDTNVNPKVSSILGTWQNLQIILGQQVQRYIQSVNTKNQNNRRGVSISDINGLLSFLESTINNTLSVTLNQKISISKLKTQQNTMNESNNGKKQTIILNESQVNNLVKKVVKESVKMVLKENQILQWTKDDFYEFVYNYLDAQNVHNGLLIDTPFGDLNYTFSDEKTTLYIWFDSEEECSKLNDYVDADDVYDISYYGNCAFIRLIDD